MVRVFWKMFGLVMCFGLGIGMWVDAEAEEVFVTLGERTNVDNRGIAMVDLSFFETYLP